MPEGSVRLGQVYDAGEELELFVAEVKLALPDRERPLLEVGVPGPEFIRKPARRGNALVVDPGGLCSRARRNPPRLGRDPRGLLSRAHRFACAQVLRASTSTRETRRSVIALAISWIRTAVPPSPVASPLTLTDAASL